MRILISGGGTGGHIYPAVSIIQEFDKTDEILYVGSNNSMESRLVPELGYKFKGITVEGFNRKNKFANIRVILKLIFALIQSIVIVLKFKPDVVIGTGGYVSGPIVFIGSLFTKKTFIHEQNAYPGLTNRILSKYVNKVFVSYEGSKNKFKKGNCIFTGNPIRKKFKENIGVKKGNRDKIKILSFGGSGGAETINNLLLSLIIEFNGDEKFDITHVTGKKYYKSFIKEIENNRIELSDNIKVIDYLSKMPETMNSANLVISRAGATTISELKYTKTPSILIPSPNVTDNHQEFNAKVLEDEKISKMIIEKDLNYKEIIDLIKSKTFIRNMEEMFLMLEDINASKKIYNEIIKESNA